MELITELRNIRKFTGFQTALFHRTVLDQHDCTPAMMFRFHVEIGWLCYRRAHTAHIGNLSYVCS